MEEWEIFIKTLPADRPKVIVDRCAHIIEAKEAQSLSIEEAGYAIWGIFAAGFDDIPFDIEEFIDLACEVEIYRDSDYYIKKGRNRYRPQK